MDVCVASRVLHTTLTGLGHDVLSARDGYASAWDQELLELAYRENRVLVTEDKDFGELVFLRRLPHPCVVRLDGLTATEESVAMRNLIERHADAMREGAIIVVTGGRVRIRPATSAGRNDN